MVSIPIMVYTPSLPHPCKGLTLFLTQCTTGGPWKGRWSTSRAKQPEEAIIVWHPCSGTPGDKAQITFHPHKPQ